MKKILVASENPVKINSTLNAFKLVFPNEEFEIEGVLVESGVSDQPMSDGETLLGATNRCNNLANLKKDFDFAVGIEGGIEKTNEGMTQSAWAVIINNKNIKGMGKTGTYFLPNKISNLVNQGIELGKACDEIFNVHNSKQSTGTVGILTHNIIDRTRYYEQAIVLALIPFINTNLF